VIGLKFIHQKCIDDPLACLGCPFISKAKQAMVEQLSLFDRSAIADYLDLSFTGLTTSTWEGVFSTRPQPSVSRASYLCV